MKNIIIITMISVFVLGCAGQRTYITREYIISDEYISWQRGIKLSLKPRKDGRFDCNYRFPDKPKDPKIFIETKLYSVIGGHRWYESQGNGGSPTEHFDPGWKYRGTTSGSFYVELEYILFRSNGDLGPNYQDRFKNYTILCSGTLRSESYSLEKFTKKSKSVKSVKP